MNTEIIDNWIKLAEYDLQTAKAMNATGRRLYVAFTCQQGIEKLLKALFVKSNKQTPPYTHNLIRLVELTLIEKELSIEQTECITVLNAYYISTRYSEELSALSKGLSKKRTEEILKNTLKVASWLKKKLK